MLGSIASITDGATGKELMSDVNRLFFARSQDHASERRLSTESNALNLDCYQRVVAGSQPELVCQGPVLSAVDLDLALQDYPGVGMRMRVSRVAGERQKHGCG
jgi:hypothetical protein